MTGRPYTPASLADQLRARINAWHAGTCTRYYDTDAELDAYAAERIEALEKELEEAYAGWKNDRWLKVTWDDAP